jgi:hypothetical protein
MRFRGPQALNDTYEKTRGWGRGAIAKQPLHRSASRNELVCFQALAHSFPRRQPVNSFHFNNFRTLSVSTGGVRTAFLTLASLLPLAGACELEDPDSVGTAWMFSSGAPIQFQLSTVNLLSAALPRVTEHGSRNTAHQALVTAFVFPYLVISLLRYLSARVTRPLLHCSTHGTPTPRPTLPRRSPLARRNRARHSRFAALHRPAPAGRRALLDRNWFRTR